MLVDMSLGALQDTKLAVQFDEAIKVVVDSFAKDEDVSGPRDITVKLSFVKNETGHIIASMSCATKTPKRTIKTLGALGDAGMLRIDTVTNDARQPSMLPEPEKKPEAVSETGGQDKH